MDRDTVQRVRDHVRRKQAAAAPTFQAAVQQMANQQLQADAAGDVRNLALASLGVGVGARGLKGLYNLVARRPPARRSGPAELPLPYPVAADEEKLAGLAAQATTKAGLPWYGPAMMLTGLGGLTAGWAGMDAALDARRRRERAQELAQAKQEFHDALLGQYDQPRAAVKAAGDDAAALAEAAARLHRVYDLYAKTAGDKTAFNWSDAAGAGLGAYGAYGALTGLGMGAFMFDKARKQSRRAILAKALQRREQRRFMEQPPEIFARPEPVAALPRVSPQDADDLYDEPE